MEMYCKWKVTAVCILLCVLYCEFIGDYVAMRQCSWPTLASTAGEDDILHTLILADTHLLGPVRGHWFDRLYREWHMHRAFQASMFIFQPDVVFVLGDLFDEGDMVNADEFADYIRRFRKHFHTPRGTRIVSAVGNHDVGFHYRMHPFYTERFEHYFNNTGVQMYTFKGVHFVLINSMAMENDGCYFCEQAQRELNRVATVLKCLKNAHNCTDRSAFKLHQAYSRPILMQHFPTYRVSDQVCQETDAPPLPNNRENWEVLSKESTRLLGELLQPRMAFGGHSHHHCFYINSLGIEEYTVASFSWRNKITPSFLLARFTKTEGAASKCDMLQQQLVINIYLGALIAFIISVSYHVFSHCKMLFGKKPDKMEHKRE